MPEPIVTSNEESLGPDLRELVRKAVEDALNGLLEAEADELVGAGRHGRTAEREAHRAGHYDRGPTTSSGEVTIHMPKLKGARLATAAIERYRRRESSVEEAMIEMCLAGVSTRRIEAVSGILWGSSASAATASNLNEKAFASVEERRNRPPGRACPYACVVMDTVVGRASDSARLLTLYHRPTGFQLAVPVPDGTCASVLAGLGPVRAALGPDGVRRVSRLVLTDNGPEFADEDGIAALLGELPGETRLFHCDPRRADQKGGCERNRVEIRKLLPKGRGISFDRLTRADAAIVMSQVNSEPRGRLAWRSPAEMLAAALGEDARPHGRLRGRDAGARRARPDAGVRGARPRREG